MITLGGIRVKGLSHEIRVKGLSHEMKTLKNTYPSLTPVAVQYMANELGGDTCSDYM